MSLNKMPDVKDLKEEGFTLAHGLRSFSPLMLVGFVTSR